MKRPPLVLATFLLGVASLLGQGQVHFSNIGDGLSISNILTLSPVPAGTTFQAALYFLPDRESAPTTADFDCDGLVLLPNATFFLFPGQFIGGSRSTPSPPFTFGWFQVRAWEAAFGSSYEQARDNPNPQEGHLASLGTSNSIRVRLGGGGGPLAVLPLREGGLKGFYVSPIPEPSALVLGIFGGFWWLLRTRR